MDRVIALIDMDCFYVQVEQRNCPESWGKPAIVVQYNEWKGGGIIAINYEARALGITKKMRGDDAKRLCADVYVFRVPEIRGKANLTRYRDAGKEVLDVFVQKCNCVEKASIDEAFLDMTDEVNRLVSEAIVRSDKLMNTHVVDYQEDGSKISSEEWLNSLQGQFASDINLRLTLGASIIQDIRDEVYRKTSFRCSAGISYNKVLSKLACSLHKPNKQTILPPSGVAKLFETLPIHKVRFLGGKLGTSVEEELGCSTMGDLAMVSLSKLQSKYDHKTSDWLYHLARGIDNEAVTSRQLPKSIGCSKNFLGKEMLASFTVVEHWMSQLVVEVSERLDKDKLDNKRLPKSMLVSATLQFQDTVKHLSRSTTINSYDITSLKRDSSNLITKLCHQEGNFRNFGVINLGVGVSKFDKMCDGAGSIEKFFGPNESNKPGSSGLSAASRKKGVKFLEPAPVSSFFTRQPLSPCKPVTIPEAGNIGVTELDSKARNASTLPLEDPVSIYELFPNLDDIDPSIVDSLPTAMQLQYQKHCQKSKKISGISHYLKSGVVVRPDTISGVPCEKCNKVIEPSKVSEHRDFHFAQEIHSDLNKSSLSGKRTNPIGIAQRHKARKISSYFTKTSLT